MEKWCSDMKFYQYINGQMVEGSSRETKVRCPGNGVHVASVALASAQQAQQALEAARDAFPIWSKMSLEERGSWICKLRDAIGEERETLHKLLILESGKISAHNAFEVDSLIHYLTYFLEQAKCEEDAILRDISGGKGYYAVTREPLGVVVASLAWNFPLHNVATKLGPILASGCTAVIKPATKTPLSTLYLGSILHRIGFPKGVVNIVAGDAGEIGTSLSASTIPAMLTMIGSTQGGLDMMRQSTTSVKRFSMELGGNAPVIVTQSADLQAAASHTMGNKMRCAGQTCVAPQRVLVHRSVWEKFTALCTEIGNRARCGMGDEVADTGALISESAVRRMEEIVSDAVEKGGRVLCGGMRPEGKEGYYFLPTILTHVTREMKAFREEIFGPILSILPYDTEEEALEIANDTQYGLAAYVWCRDYPETARLVKGLAFGVVNVNGPGTGPNYPHGGWKDSGIGADGSRYSLEEYYRKKGIRVALY